MRFFLYEVVARIVAIYLCFDCGRKLRYGLAERKIAYFNSNFLGWSIGLLIEMSRRSSTGYKSASR
jgi:hypothetical protein